MQTEMAVLVTLWLLVALMGLVYLFLRWNFNYWWYGQVNGPKPVILFGNLPSAVTKKRHVMHDIWDIYLAYKAENDFVGIFDKRTPKLLVLSPKLARQIYVTDFKCFHDNDRSRTISERVDFLFANNPFVAQGEKWKQRRSEIIPGLTPARIKAVFPVTLEICKRMTDYVQQQNKVPPAEGFDAKDLFSRFMADIICDCVMGIQSDSFAHGSTSSPLLVMQHNMFTYSPWYTTIIGLLPWLSALFKQRFLTKEFEKYFMDLMDQAVALRKSQAEGEQRIDFLNYMLQLQANKQLSNKEISAHAMTFLLDGFETVSSVLAHTMLLVARHPEIQQRLRQEIKDKVANKLEFETLNDLPYLNACIHEAIRLFPVTFHSHKVCTERVRWTNKNGRTLYLPLGMTVIIPQYQIMMDEDIYPDPTVFKPERFLEENGGVKKYMDMGAYWGYGDGPRVCLGFRFGLVQVKAAMVALLQKFNVKPNAKTRKDNEFDPTYFLARLNGGVYLDFEAIN